MTDNRAFDDEVNDGDNSVSIILGRYLWGSLIEVAS